MNVRHGRNHGTMVLGVQWHSSEHIDKNGVVNNIQAEKDTPKFP